ncbi:MAG: TonB-dependent receptor, partial [Candidatus Thermoplasmatota archaeon]|nr:TonB-dependent receptor [Candidatus Thermoplasmatota archaeon]
ENFFGIFQFDYDGKYLADVMYRYDGSSLFGENERWQPYYRVSAAYRLTEDITIPGIQEFKLRAAYGTSGQRPGFSAQYETYNFVAGFPQQYTMGNKDLKPSRSTEIETGFNIEFLNRFNFEFIYSNTNTDDQIMLAILPAYYGFVKQWQNAGALESNVFEATLGAKIMKTKDFSWSATLLFDRIRQTVTELDIPPFQTGPVGQDADQVFYIREGETFGIIYGSEFLTDLDDLVPQLEDGDDISNYEINSDGYVVPYGSQGTIHEKPIKLLDENGNPAKAVIGNTNSDFHMGLSTILQYKGFSVYALLDWKNGGDVYNRTKQWLYRDLRHGDIDQFDKDPNQKKTVNYYSTLYDVNDVNSHFVEDASYLKLRELSLYYTFNKENLSNFCWGAFESIKLGFIGRNLLTFTGYSGYDPEVGQINNSIFGNAQFFSFDAYGYPNYRTYSGSLTIVF